MHACMHGACRHAPTCWSHTWNVPSRVINQPVQYSTLSGHRVHCGAQHLKLIHFQFYLFTVWHALNCTHSLPSLAIRLRPQLRQYIHCMLFTAGRHWRKFALEVHDVCVAWLHRRNSVQWQISARQRSTFAFWKWRLEILVVINSRRHPHTRTKKVSSVSWFIPRQAIEWRHQISTQSPLHIRCKVSWQIPRQTPIKANIMTDSLRRENIIIASLQNCS
jgi:hypothetical protein